MHGGGAPQVKAKAAERVAQAQLDKEIARELQSLGVAVYVDPIDAITESIWQTNGTVAYLQRRVQELEHDVTVDNEERVLVKLYNQALERLARLAKLALDAGLEERQVRLAEDQGRLVAELFRAALDDRELGLSELQKSRAQMLISTRVRELAVGGDASPS